MAVNTHRASSIAVFILAVLLGVIIAVRPASASDTDMNVPTPEPTLVAPRADVPIVVEAPYWSWGLRHVIRNIDSQIDLDIIYRRGATCEAYPERRCLTVTFENTPDARYFGKYWYNDEEGTYAISLNNGKMPWAQALKVPTAAHEFGHFLGFAHHDVDGLMGHSTWFRYVQPSESEYAALAAYYV